MAEPLKFLDFEPFWQKNGWTLEYSWLWNWLGFHMHMEENIKYSVRIAEVSCQCMIHSKVNETWKMCLNRFAETDDHQCLIVATVSLPLHWFCKRCFTMSDSLYIWLVERNSECFINGNKTANETVDSYSSNRQWECSSDRSRKTWWRARSQCFRLSCTVEKIDEAPVDTDDADGGMYISGRCCYSAVTCSVDHVIWVSCKSFVVFFTAMQSLSYTH